MTEVAHRLSTSKSTDDVTNILHCTYELRRIENPNEQQLGRKPARLNTSPGRRILLCLGNFTLCFLNQYKLIVESWWVFIKYILSRVPGGEWWTQVDVSSRNILFIINIIFTGL
ncbi:hypothetical protein SFRURICE_001819 [Spodoptera frugiperda]|nr:hypothetical protein SFRURICE_001819 [Spodoptera frugiperda]